MTRRRSVLIVDDDFDMRDALADVLLDEGYDVHTASDGDEALDYLRTHEAPGLILLDWMMPRCDGACFRRQQLADRTLASIPVVLLTADPQLEAKKQMLAADDHLAKPIELSDLLALMTRVFA